ncbi:peptidyl-prolyl cis-trans isomerase D-like [Agrilus planipennis]|uniref:Peptidyl-prolyl cis-trans isomerase n=1 Tax=Agrilus planipennis TaxID=224129 RepID=A0A1W4X2Y9_AGRPL|nr:peptidyl-prolyl cis-trans isomerase D-like [Agrilus planipennis]
MANKGPNTNNSQFYITTVPCNHLDGRNVAFGKVVRGLNVIKEMSDVPRNEDVPLEPCVIEDCGELKNGAPLDVSEHDSTEDTFPPWPDDWEIETEKQPDEFIKAASMIKNSGNFYYKNKQFYDAHRKYKKAIRYIEYLEKKKLPFNEKEAHSVKVTSMLNFAAVKLKKGKHLDALKVCNKILSINPDDRKALFRRAQARVGLKEYDEALNDLKNLLKLYPKEKEVINELENVMKLKSNYLLKEKILFTKMFKNMQS